MAGWVAGMSQKAFGGLIASVTAAASIALTTACFPYLVSPKLSADIVFSDLIDASVQERITSKVSVVADGTPLLRPSIGHLRFKNTGFRHIAEAFSVIVRFQVDIVEPPVSVGSSLRRVEATVSSDKRQATFDIPFLNMDEELDFAIVLDKGLEASTGGVEYSIKKGGIVFEEKALIGQQPHGVVLKLGAIGVAVILWVAAVAVFKRRMDRKMRQLKEELKEENEILRRRHGYIVDL